MRVLRTLVPVLALLAAGLVPALGVAPGTVALVPQDDAGSGGDAPDGPQPDVVIASGGSYAGRLAGDDRQDWYAFQGEAGDRVRVKALGAYGCVAVLDGGAEPLAHTCIPGPLHRPQERPQVRSTAVALLDTTLPSDGTWYVRYMNVPADAYRFSLGVGEDAPPLEAGPARVEDPLVPSVQDDGGSGGDAPGHADPSVPIASGAVTEGELAGPLADDREDWYVFEAAAGDHVEVAFHTDRVACAEIVDGGVPRASACSNPVSDASGTPRTSVTLSEAGTYYVRVQHEALAQTYRIGFGLNEPAPTPEDPPTVPVAAGASALASPGEVPAGDAWTRAATLGSNLRVPVDDGVLELDLRVNRELVADGVHAAGDAVPLAGEVEDAPGSWLRVVVHEGDVRGWVHVPDLGTLRVTPDADGVPRWLPADDADDDASGPIDLPATDPGTRSAGAGGVRMNHATGCTQATPHYLAHPGGLALGWPERTLEVAFAADDDFTSTYGSDWDARALELANGMDGFLDASLDLRVQVVDLHGHDGEIPGSDTGQLLSSLRGHYDDAHPDLDRENVHLFTTASLEGIAVGQANCIGGAGNPSVAYTMGLAEPDGRTLFNEPNLRALKIASHEVGHILGAHHHYANCAERATQYDPFRTLDTCTLMFNDVGFVSMQFSNVNKLVTRGWADAEGL